MHLCGHKSSLGINIVTSALLPTFEMIINELQFVRYSDRGSAGGISRDVTWEFCSWEKLPQCFKDNVND